MGLVFCPELFLSVPSKYADSPIAAAMTSEAPDVWLALVKEIGDANMENLTASKLTTPAFRKLNLGCGFDLREGYVNVDFQDFHKPDVVADVRDHGHAPVWLVEEIIARDVLEHLPAWTPQRLWRSGIVFYVWRLNISPHAKYYRRRGVTCESRTGRHRESETPGAVSVWNPGIHWRLAPHRISPNLSYDTISRKQVSIF